MRFRNSRTLALFGNMPKYESVQWWRRAVDAGEFSIDVNRQQIDVSDIPRLAVFEIMRDNVPEFAGVVENREYDALTQTWTLSGRDLKGFWLSSRQIDPGFADEIEFDDQLAIPAETAMKHYVTDHLVAPIVVARTVDDELTGIDFTVEGTHGFGEDVHKNARWENLLSVLIELAHKGVLLHDVVMKDGYTGYEYRVSEPVDATESTGATPVIFSVSSDNVGEAVYVEQYSNIVNAMYVMGSGSGATRTIREVDDQTSIDADFRREGHIDGRQAEDDNDRLDMVGAVAILRSLVDARTARMQPLNLDPTRYRSEWDLGHEVTVVFDVIGVQVDIRIEEIYLSLEHGGS